METFFLSLIKRILPLRLKLFLKKKISKNINQVSESEIGQPIVPLRSEVINSILEGAKINCIDVGSANGLQPHWSRMYHNINLLAFEPHPKSYEGIILQYKEKIESGEFKVLLSGLSDTGGKRILYSTNVPTGSSLLEPDITLDEVKNSNYFFPWKEIEVNTLSLADAIQREKFPLPDIIKLDIQGLEYDVISSFSNEIKKNLLFVEVEINLTSVYKGQKHFNQYLKLFQEMGFQLLDFRTTRGFTPINSGTDFYKEVLGDFQPYEPSMAQKIIEVDAVFVKNYASLLEEKNQERLRKIISILCVYNFYYEAILILKQAFEAKIFSKEEFDSLLIRIKHLNQCMQMELDKERAFLGSKDGIIWAQYMNVPYPSF